ncbi:type I-E CRISPR-associated protein Cas7/Cse4/CasC [Streptomyces yaizuensis]|uniref:Type I-E CRISPR-associated protein Cas7/Cse4/CasC n=1 Tax=Streptomyces yaizuensis TaxID=2989713 RepID=A0ABQ5P7F6_9ACTN|nr:type I-E CRISPR-associated protein Cas7/Cse4/CasC [Streptomyces sp. YSPA8]GLF98166.1 type I-E CRISPR-associated protein Cas7/Cse4/CasC [Streptomyces sp. YSPA8]
MSVHLDLHALQTLPPSNINRDDLGSPKTATYGGVRRARVSSQSWKRAMREKFTTAGLVPAEDLAVRTRHGIGLLATSLCTLRPGLGKEAAAEIAEKVLTQATGASTDTAATRRKTTVTSAPPTKEILFLGHRQIDRLAALAAEGADDITAFLKTRTNATALTEAVRSADAVDIALFGRMIAAGDDLNVDAAVQVAHALAVHRTPVEADFFSAVDDLAHDTGAGMIGQREFTAPTLYRYASLTGPDLATNLTAYAGAMTVQTVTAAVVRVFAESLPSGSVTSYAHQTRPTVLIATVTGTPLSHAAAFETPVETAAGGYLPAAAARLAEHASALSAAYGDPAAVSWILTTDPRASEPLHALATRTATIGELADTAAAELAARTTTARAAA